MSRITTKTKEDLVESITGLISDKHSFDFIFDRFENDTSEYHVAVLEYELEFGKGKEKNVVVDRAVAPEYDCFYEINDENYKALLNLERSDLLDQIIYSEDVLKHNAVMAPLFYDHIKNQVVAYLIYDGIFEKCTMINYDMEKITIPVD